MKKLSLFLILTLFLTGCTAWKNYRAKKLIEKAKDKLERAEGLKPGSVTGDTLQTPIIVEVPVTIPGDTIKSIFINDAMRDTVHRIESERGTTIIEIDYPDYAEKLFADTEELPEKVRKRVRDALQKTLESEIRYKVNTEIAPVDTTLQVEITKETIATIVFQDRAVEKTPARNKWLIALLIAVLAAVFAMVFLFLRKKRAKD